MKLNPDCVRDIMLELEESLSINMAGYFEDVSITYLCRKFVDDGKYDPKDIKYSLIQLHESGYIVSDLKIDIEHGAYTIYSIFYITPKGHEFLSSLQINDVWSKARPIFRTLGNVSLSIIESVSKGFAEAFINGLMQGQV